MLVEQMQTKGYVPSTQNPDIDMPAAQEKQSESSTSVGSIWVNTGGSDG